MLNQIHIREAIEAVASMDVRDILFGPAVIAQAEVIAARLRE